ncbi:hypothetical protein, partial [Roseateles koreensis]
VINKAGVKVDYTGGAWSGQPSTSAGGAEGLGYFGVMKVKDAGFDDKLLLKDRRGQPIGDMPFTVRNRVTGQKEHGRTTADGLIKHAVDGTPEQLEIQWGTTK